MPRYQPTFTVSNEDIVLLTMFGGLAAVIGIAHVLEYLEKRKAKLDELDKKRKDPILSTKASIDELVDKIKAGVEIKTDKISVDIGRLSNNVLSHVTEVYKTIDNYSKQVAPLYLKYGKLADLIDNDEYDSNQFEIDDEFEKVDIAVIAKLKPIVGKNINGVIVTVKGAYIDYENDYKANVKEVAICKPKDLTGMLEIAAKMLVLAVDLQDRMTYCTYHQNQTMLGWQWSDMLIATAKDIVTYVKKSLK